MNVDWVRWFGDYNRGDLMLLGDRRPWEIAVLGVVAALLCVFTWVDARDLGVRRAATLVATRAMALGIALVLLLEPAVELRKVRVVPNHVAVLVDASASQSLDVGGASRWQRSVDAARAVVAQLDGAAERHRVSVVTFGETSSAVGAAALGDVAPTADATRTLEALRAFVQAHGPGEVGGVVVVSDGIDQGELAHRTRRGEALDTTTRQWLERQGVPVHTVASAGAGEVRDIAVDRVAYDDFAFVRHAVSVTAELRVLGFDEGELPVALLRDGAVLQTRTVVVEPGVTSYPVRFSFVPEHVGTEVYTVQTPVRDGEALRDNNEDHFVLKVIRDKIRVVQVVGRPSWDVRFLRQLLQNNPNVELINFFILRTQSDVHRGAERELSLIPFPTDELFSEQLGSFDLIILQNFDYGPYSMSRYLPGMRDYVKQGGALLMIGGDLSFSAGAYAGTPIEEVLPVRLPPNGPSAIDWQPFRPRLTEAGELHPITRVEFDAARNAAVWASFPEMRGTNRVLEAVPGAVTLAVHPTLRAGNAPMPVIAVADVERGRSMAVTVDDAWRWSFERVGRGEGTGPYASFWGSAIRWLIRDPALNLLDVSLPQQVVDPATPEGREVVGAIRLNRPDYAPAADVEGTLTFVAQPFAGDDRAPRTTTQAFVTDAAGRATFRYVVDGPGAYEVTATVEQPNGPTLEDREVFLAISRRNELRDIEPRPDLLRALSDATGATHVRAGGAVPTLRFLPPRVEEVDRREVIDAWSSPFVLLLLVALLGFDWTMRRRWGRL